MKKLEQLEMVAVESNRQYSIITICNWDEYQQPNTREVTSKGQASDKQVTSKGQASDTDNNVNNVDNVNNVKKEKEKTFPPPVTKFVKSFYRYLSENGGKKKYTEKEIASADDTIDKLVRLDGYDLEGEIKPALRWGISDDFWSGQIRSLSALRKKGKNGEKKFTNLFNQYSASNSPTSTRQKGNSLSEFEKLIRRKANERNCNFEAAQERDCIDATG